MTWFKVDDKFHGSKEVLLIPQENRFEAIGIWTITGAYSADHLTDGFIADYVLEAMGIRRDIAMLLVRPAKLWTRKRDGFQFRNWEKWQITRAEVEKTRQAERDRKAAYRSKSQQTYSDVPGGVPLGQIHLPDTPTRPDPTRPIKGLERSASVVTKGPWCTRHPGGTETSCGPCRTARIAFEAAQSSATAATTVKAVTATPKRYKPADGHPHRVSPGGTHCELCETRIT